MILSDFVTEYTGQAVDVDGVKQDTGQCLQLVSLYQQKVQATTVFFTPGAADYWNKFAGSVLEQYYDKIPVGQPVQAGDIVVFGASSVINSPDFGHIDICLQPTSGGYTGFDSNWGGVKDTNPNSPTYGYPVAHQVAHSFTDVLGYLRLKGENMNPTPAQAGTTYAAFATQPDGITPGDISQKDLDTAIQTPWAEWIPNFYQGVQNLRNDIKLLTTDRDDNLYPFINAVTSALGIPDTSNIDAAVAAINALKNAQGGVSKASALAYIEKNLE